VEFDLSDVQVRTRSVVGFMSKSDVQLYAVYAPAYTFSLFCMQALAGVHKMAKNMRL